MASPEMFWAFIMHAEDFGFRDAVDRLTGGQQGPCAPRHVRPGGRLVAACCTSRIERAAFHDTVRKALGPSFFLDHEIPPEIDHPVGFPQADYLKLAWWTRSP